MKRWYSFIESYSLKIIHKLGAKNVVADALLSIQVNHLTESIESVSGQNTQHSAKSSFANVIQKILKPI